MSRNMINTNKRLFDRLKKELPEYVTGLQLDSHVVRYLDTNDLEENVLKYSKIIFKIPIFRNKSIYCVKYGGYNYIVIPEKLSISNPFSTYVLDNGFNNVSYNENAGLLTLLWSEDYPLKEFDRYELVQNIFGKTGIFTVSDLQPFFADMDVWRLNKNITISESLFYSLYISYLCNTKIPFHLNFSENTINHIYELCENETAQLLGENLYMCLTSTHWKHSFLELYRCLENLFYFPYIRNLYNFYGKKVSINKISESFEKILGWHPKEEDALTYLIGGLKSKGYFDDFINTIEPITESDKDIDKSRILARRIYKVRNKIAHWSKQSLYDANTWDTIIKYTCELIDDIYYLYRYELSQFALTEAF